MFSEVNTVFSQFRGNILTNLRWSFKLYQGSKVFLILSLHMRSMIISVKISFHNTPVQSVLKNKNQSPSRFVMQTLLANIVLLDGHSFGVRRFIQKNKYCVFIMGKNVAQ